MKVRGWAKLCTPEGHSQIRCMLSCEFSQCSMFTYKGRFSFVVLGPAICWCSVAVVPLCKHAVTNC